MEGDPSLVDVLEAPEQVLLEELLECTKALQMLMHLTRDCAYRQNLRVAKFIASALSNMEVTHPLPLVLNSLVTINLHDRVVV